MLVSILIFLIMFGVIVIAHEFGHYKEKWLARQRRLRQEKEDRQSQVSEFRQQVLEQQLDLGRPPAPADPEHRPESARWALGAGRGPGWVGGAGRSLRLASALV